jgi:hypothetical protein
MQTNTETNDFLVVLIDRLTPLNNKWRETTDALTKIELMWEIGHKINYAVKNSNFGLDELLRNLYDPHGKKISYITRDLGSYSHRIYLYFKSKEDIRVQLKGLTNFTLFREAFPLLTNEKYNLNEDQKSEIISAVVNYKDTKSTQDELKKLKQNIRPIKNTRTTKALQYSDESKWLIGIRESVVSYYKENEDFDQLKFPVSIKMIDDLKPIIMALISDKKTEVLVVDISDENLRKIATIANSTTEDKCRFKKWGLDTYRLMTLAEMLSATSSQEKYNFVRKKIANS